MKEKNRKQKGSVQILLLTGILVVLVIVLYKQGKLEPLINVSQVFKVLENTEITKEQALSEQIHVGGKQSLTEETKQGELEKKLPEETEKVTNIERVDQGLIELIIESEQWVDEFSHTEKEVNDFTYGMQEMMAAFPNVPLLQEFGQMLIGELDNMSFISEKLLSIEHTRIEKLSLHLGTGSLPLASELSYLNAQFDTYYDQYNSSKTKIYSLVGSLRNIFFSE